MKRQSLLDLVKNQNLTEIYKEIPKRKQIGKVKIYRSDKTGQEMQTKRNNSFSVKSVILHTKFKRNKRDQFLLMKGINYSKVITTENQCSWIFKVACENSLMDNKLHRPHI